VVLDVLGTGGMGLVYAAYDPMLDRKVAIKVLRTGASGSSSGSRDSAGTTRLIREAQAMAKLSHPNVVPVYEVGELDDSVFVAMELITGQTFSLWCRTAEPDWRRILAVLSDAGRGLEAAHAAGLIHRDFKPANVLVGDDGRARVSDFGLARSTRGPVEKQTRREGPADPLSTGPISLDTPLTQAGSIMGSPGYMAPEQYVGAQTSAATDQYAFCVVLYEALYGQRPFVGSDLAALGLATREGKVPPAPKGSPVPPWVFAIIAQGLSPDPARRHASMTALLEALGRDPARVRNRRLLLALLGVLELVVFSAISLSRQHDAAVCVGRGEQVLEVWNDEHRGQVSQAFSATNRSYAALTLAHVTGALDAWAREWAAERTEVCAARRIRREASPRATSLRIACLERRLAEFRTLTSALETADADLVAQATVTVNQLTPVSSCRNLPLLESRATLAPTAEQDVQRLEQQLLEGWVLTHAGRFVDARARIEPAVEKARLLGVAAFEAEAMLCLGELEAELDRYEESRTALARGLERALAAADDRTAIEVIAHLVTVVGWRLERPAEAMLLSQVGRALLLRLGGDARLEARLDESTGDAQWQAGDRVASLANYREALALTQALEGPESVDVARQRSAISWVLMEQGHLHAAREQSDQSRLIRERLLGADHPSLASNWNELGTLAEESGDVTEAVRCFQRSYDITVQTVSPSSPRALGFLLNMVEVLPEDDGAEAAEALLGRVMKAVTEADPLPTSRLVQLERSRAKIALGQGHAATAVVLSRQALQHAVEAFTRQHPDSAGTLLVLADSLAAAGQCAEAVAAFEQYLELARTLSIDKAPDTVRALVQSASCLLRLGRAPEAVARAERAMAALDHLEGNERLRAEARLALAEALVRVDPTSDRVRPLAEQAREQWQRLGRPAQVAKVDAFLAGVK
jgi:serine/threonine protein kinase/tetratricopeptide (TPR) repeat protein